MKPISENTKKLNSDIAYWVSTVYTYSLAEKYILDADLPCGM